MSDGSQILVFDFKLIPIPVSVVEADVFASDATEDSGVDAGALGAATVDAEVMADALEVDGAAGKRVLTTALGCTAGTLGAPVPIAGAAAALVAGERSESIIFDAALTSCPISLLLQGL